MRRFVKVTAKLAAPLALSADGVPPHLDALCECVMARKDRSIAESSNGHRHAIDIERPRGQGVSRQGQLPIPIRRIKVDGIPVPCCSQGIIESLPESAEHYHCAFPVERSWLLSEKQRTTLATTGGVYKSMRLPLRLSHTSQVIWFAELRERPARLRAIVKQLDAIGNKANHGYGLVSEWLVEQTAVDAAWFHDGVLMRPLPLSAVPEDTQGKRRGFGAVAGPYWQANFFVERWEPC